MQLDFEWCYRAVDSRDSRFDGWFYTAVTSTGIYCRSSCPARTPLRRNVRFYPSAAAAQSGGFRACRRCRPDTVPGSPEWDTRADVAARAMRLIADGVVDRDGVPGLARRLGYTERHLHRMLTAEVGAGPLALARAQRAQAARVLIETTGLGLAEIAFAAGFGSVRQFNDTVRQVYGVAPSALRRGSARSTGAAGLAGAAGPAGETIALRLAYRPPLHAAALLGFLGTRAVPGVEARDGDTYRRALRLPHGPATVALVPADGQIRARLQLSDVRDLAPAVARCRRLLDLDADPVAVDAALAADPALAPGVADDPGVRVPRAVDGFEIAVRAVVGQQVSVAGARTVLARMITQPPDESEPLVPFPGPEEVLELPETAFAMPGRRRQTIRELAGAVAGGTLDLDPGADRTEVAARLRQIKGIGDWTADYIALRALGEPDAFLPTDLGVRRGAAALGLPDDPATLATHADKHWAPWRSYALIRLWRYA
ncbi:MAG: helix-turn-helix domain-containing protein [Micromonosporaceae bacterium]|nr:helix-turn-helix domain-containing protein [Micromonosporaceae bacterium]